MLLWNASPLSLGLAAANSRPTLACAAAESSFRTARTQAFNALARSSSLKVSNLTVDRVRVIVLLAIGGSCPTLYSAAEWRNSHRDMRRAPRAPGERTFDLYGTTMSITCGHSEADGRCGRRGD